MALFLPKGAKTGSPLRIKMIPTAKAFSNPLLVCGRLLLEEGLFCNLVFIRATQMLSEDRG